MKSFKADIVIIGGSVGGCAAALAAASMGKTVILTEETDWIGGQLTSQAVPPDEHPWIEKFGATRRYREFRNQVRHYYRDHFPLTPKARENSLLNPGNGTVSRLCHEPRVALAVFNQMLAPYINSGRIRLLLKHVPIEVDVEENEARSVVVKSLESGSLYQLEGAYILDATETGELLPLAKMEYVVGAESKLETGEPHAVDGPADPRNQQAISICYAVDYIPGADHTIAKPASYEFWRQYKPDFWPDKLLSWTTSHPITLGVYNHSLFEEANKHSLFKYRQIVDKANFVDGTYASNVTLVNWPQIDYWLGPIIDVSEEERARHLQMAKELSLSMLYWMQTEAPRPDGGQGYPGLRLREDIVGTEDGLAKYPYIRESRRIKAEFTVLEQHVAVDARQTPGAEKFADSVGVGCYRIDLHPTSEENYIDISSWPFQIPLGALIPIRMENLLPACKNIGVTHITNGCYRLHPVEWNIGESVGYLVAYCLNHRVKPRQVRNTPGLLQDFQRLLENQGVELDWPVIRAV